MVRYRRGYWRRAYVRKDGVRVRRTYVPGRGLFEEIERMKLPKRITFVKKDGYELEKRRR
jgi:hypothetical protein